MSSRSSKTSVTSVPKTSAGSSKRIVFATKKLDLDKREKLMELQHQFDEDLDKISGLIEEEQRRPSRKKNWEAVAKLKRERERLIRKFDRNLKQVEEKFALQLEMVHAGIIPEMDEELRLLSPSTMAYLEKRNTHGFQGFDVSDVWKREDNFEQLEETTKTQPLIVCAYNTPVSVSLQKSPVETVQVQKTPATDERPSSPYNINKWMADKEKAKEEERLKRLERKLAASVPASTPKSARNLEVRVTRSRVTVVKVGRDEDENEDKRKVALDSVRKRIKFDENSEETFTSSSPPEVASEVQEEEEYRLMSTDSSSTNGSNAKENHEDDMKEVTKENEKGDEDDIKELTKKNGKHDEEDDHNSENMDLLGILVSKGDKQIGNHRSSSQEILSSSSSPLRQKQITVPIRTPSKRKSAQIATLLLSSSKKSKTQPTAQESNAPKRKGQGRPRKI